MTYGKDPKTKKQNSMYVPVEPAVIGPIRVTRDTADTNFPVHIPWKNCRLTYAYAATTTIVATADMTIDLLLDSASGTNIGTITIATSGSGIAVIDELGTAAIPFTTPAAAQNLDRDSTDRDFIYVQCKLHASGAGAADVWLYFEQQGIA